MTSVTPWYSADLADRRDERLRRLALVMARIDDAAAMVDDIEERNRFEARRSLRQAEALVDRIRQPVLLDELPDRLVLPPLAVASDKYERLVLEGLPELLHPRQQRTAGRTADAPAVDKHDLAG